MDYTLAQEASWGMHDDEVGRLTGVYNRDPYDNVMEKVYGGSTSQSTFGNLPSTRNPASSQPRGVYPAVPSYSQGWSGWAQRLGTTGTMWDAPTVAFQGELGRRDDAKVLSNMEVYRSRTRKMFLKG